MLEDWTPQDKMQAMWAGWAAFDGVLVEARRRGNQLSPVIAEEGDVAQFLRWGAPVGCPGICTGGGRHPAYICVPCNRAAWVCRADMQVCSCQGEGVNLFMWLQGRLPLASSTAPHCP